MYLENRMCICILDYIDIYDTKKFISTEKFGFCQLAEPATNVQLKNKKDK